MYKQTFFNGTGNVYKSIKSVLFMKMAYENVITLTIEQET